MSFTNCMRNYSLSTIRAFKRCIHSSPKLNCIVDGGAGTHKPTSFHRKILIWTNAYKSDSDIPPRVTKSQMKNAMDRFRIKVSLGMLGATFIACVIIMIYGKKERTEGKSVTRDIMDKRAKNR